MANVEVSRLLAEIAANGDPDIEASRLLVEVVSDYVPDEALLNSTLTNAGNSLTGLLEDSASAGVHELYLCVLNSLDTIRTRPPGSSPPTPPPPIPGEWEPTPGQGNDPQPGDPFIPVDPYPDYTGLVFVAHELYLMVLRREMPLSAARPKFFTYLIPD